MYLVNLKRVTRSGFVNFWRNGYVSLASVLVMIITLFTIGSVIFLSAVLNTSLDEIKNKVDVNVYFVTSADEADILSLKKTIETLPEVKEVTYLTRDQVLENFKKRHENDSTALQALDELGDNPLGATLNIKAKETSQYESIANFLDKTNILSKDGISIIDKVNYLQNKVAIERLSKLIDSSNKLGLALTIILVAVSVLITFNTIRLAIYISREEISVMKLVGASNKYIRGPFLVTGVMYGVLAGIVTLVIFYPITLWLGPMTQNFFIGINLFQYYMVNFGEIAGVILVSGVLIGGISSFLAVRKYLRS